MKVVLLPGLDGTGDLFHPFVDYLSLNCDVQIITYSTSKRQTYEDLTELVVEQLPHEQFVIVAESFSGYIAYQIARLKIPSLINIIFVASFLDNPKPLLLKFSKILPISFIFSLPPPNFNYKDFSFGRK